MSELYNPRDRIKKHLKRKSSSRNINNGETSLSNTFTSFEEIDTESCPVPSTSNPFKVSSPLKKRRPTQTHVTFAESEENAQDSSFGASLLKKSSTSIDLSNSKRKINFERFQSFDASLVQEVHACDFSQMMSQQSSFSKIESEKEKFEESEELPLDLRIGTKLRVVSKTAFPWMISRKTTGIVAVRIPASERYKGMKYFNEMYLTGTENPTIPIPPAQLSILEAATLYWQFPVVTGMSLYPRITSELKSIDRVPLAPLAIKTMSNQWVECYEQLFMSYKKGERESFYVASAVFNVLFTKTAISDEVVFSEESQSCFRSFNGQSLVALVSHTSSATREHLRNQGVDYEVIGAKGIKRVNSFSSQQCGVDYSESKDNSVSGIPDEVSLENVKPENDDDDEKSDENESPTKSNQKWLKDIGVSPRNVMRSTSRRKLSTQISDRDGISCLLVKGSAVQSLYNTLMSSDIVQEKTGPYTKIPPTLMATSPFLYGQLLSLNKTSQVISKAVSKTTEYILELEGGPILPHCTRLMTEFLRKSDLCSEAVTMQVSDRHTNNGMNEWTNRAENWNVVQVLPDCVKWTKSV